MILCTVRLAVSCMMFRSISQCPELEADPTVKGEVARGSQVTGHRSINIRHVHFVVAVYSCITTCLFFFRKWLYIACPLEDFSSLSACLHPSATSTLLNKILFLACYIHLINQLRKLYWENIGPRS